METWSLDVKKISLLFNGYPPPHPKLWLQGYFGMLEYNAVIGSVACHQTQVFLILKLSLNFPRLFI